MAKTRSSLLARFQDAGRQRRVQTPRHSREAGRFRRIQRTGEARGGHHQGCPKRRAASRDDSRYPHQHRAAAPAVVVAAPAQIVVAAAPGQLMVAMAPGQAMMGNPPQVAMGGRSPNTPGGPPQQPTAQKPKAKIPLDELESIRFERTPALAARFIGQPNLDFTMPGLSAKKDDAKPKAEAKKDDKPRPKPRRTTSPRPEAKKDEKPKAEAKKDDEAQGRGQEGRQAQGRGQEGRQTEG